MGVNRNLNLNNILPIVPRKNKALNAVTHVGKAAHNRMNIRRSKQCIVILFVRRTESNFFVTTSPINGEIMITDIRARISLPIAVSCVLSHHVRFVNNHVITHRPKRNKNVILYLMSQVF